MVDSYYTFSSIESGSRVRWRSAQDARTGPAHDVFSRLNVAEYVQDLESEGVSDLNFQFVEHVVRQFRTKPGLQAFIREYEDTYVGSDELLERLGGRRK